MTTAPRLIIWRHGQTDWNISDRFQGHADIALNETGYAQAAAAAAVLAAHAPGAIVSSDLTRATHTASVLGERVGLPVVTDARCREVDTGEWTGLTIAEVMERFPDSYRDWRRGETIRFPGGETHEEVAARSVAAIREQLATRDGTIVVVTHGGVGRGIVAHLLGLAASARRTFVPLANACWASLEQAHSEWRLVAYNVGVA